MADSHTSENVGYITTSGLEERQGGLWRLKSQPLPMWCVFRLVLQTSDNSCSGRWFGGGQCPCLELALLTASCARSGNGNLLYDSRQDKKITSFQPAWLIRCSTPH